MEENSLLNFPKSTEFNKRIPKQKFYENIAVTPAMKKAFVEQIRIIYWRNKIATTTLNLAAGGQVMEIEVVEVRLSAPELDERRAPEDCLCRTYSRYRSSRRS